MAEPCSCISIAVNRCLLTRRRRRDFQLLLSRSTKVQGFGQLAAERYQPGREGAKTLTDRSALSAPANYHADGGTDVLSQQKL
jgi:hypothetical protein